MKTFGIFLLSLVYFGFGFSLQAQLAAPRSTEYNPSGADRNYVPISPSDLPDCGSFSNPLELVFSDNFNDGVLDETKWYHQLPWGMANSDGGLGWCNEDDIHFDGDGLVKFGARYNPNNNVPLDGTIVSRPYSIGVISTHEEFGYGYYEMSCKIPTICRTWPAFWLFGDYGQEIDIFEFRGFPSKHKDGCDPDLPRWYMPMDCATASPIMTWHAPNGLGGATRAEGVTNHYEEWDVHHTTFNFGQGCEYTSEVDVDFHNYFHKFAVDFNPVSIIWYIDDVPVRWASRYYYYNSSTSQYVPFYSSDQFCDRNFLSSVQLYEQKNFPKGEAQMHVIMGTGVDDINNWTMGWAGDFNLYDYTTNVPNWTPGYLVVDWFNYYKRSYCSHDGSFCSFPQLQSNSAYYDNTYSAENITIGGPSCNFVVNNGNEMNLKVYNETNITGEFTANLGSSVLITQSQCRGYGERMSSEPNHDEMMAIYSREQNSFNAGNHPSDENEVDTETRAINWTVKPNPSTGIFYVVFNQPCNATTKVFDVIGNLVKSSEWSDTPEHTLDLTGFSKGLYTIQISVLGKTQTQKIILE